MKKEKLSLYRKNGFFMNEFTDEISEKNLKASKADSFTEEALKRSGAKLS